MSDGKHKPAHSKKVVSQTKRVATLKNLLAYYKEITETVREPVLILDKDLSIVTANMAFYKKFKVLKKDTEGRNIYELGNNQWNSKELRTLLEHILPKHRVLNNYEVTHNFPTIGTRTMLLNARQVDSKQLILLALEDVTLQRKLLADTAKLTKSLIQQRDQIKGLSDAKDEFISLASHQLRTPATAVKQYIAMLTHGYAGKLTQEQLSMLATAYESNERHIEIIDDLLRVARVDAGKVYLEKSKCDIGAQIESVIKGQAVLFKNRGQHVSFVKPISKIFAFIDPKLMLMVIENLLDNAGKYSNKGQHITVSLLQDQTNTTVSIKDNGVGIGKVDISKLFKKFIRLDNAMSNSVKGTGLGLYWVKKILDLHGGSIKVVSAKNKGSTFIVKIPILAKG